MNVNEMENYIIKSYNPITVNIQPKTERELLNIYYKYTDVLYQYLRYNVDNFMHALNNEIRAMLGHLAEYRISDTGDKRDLDKAYGHFRRLNLDALKILCDEFDRTLSKKLKQQYKYDYRNTCADYLKEFGERYIKAKNLYIKAQEDERVGCDSHTHNIIKLYYDAAKEYILLKQYYDSKKKVIQKAKREIIIKRFIMGILTVIGIVSSALSFL